MPKRVTPTNAVPISRAIFAESAGCFVVRSQELCGGRIVVRDAVLFPSLEGARHWCQQLGLTPQGRLPEDEPKLVEVWTQAVTGH